MKYLATPNGERIYTIYKATNLVNEKVYIGFDSNWPRRRNQHKNNALTNKIETKFYDAIRKHGWENFKWEIICQSLNCKFLAETMETYFIENYDSYRNGYNSTTGGQIQFNFEMSEAHKKKLSNAAKKRWSNPVEREHIEFDNWSGNDFDVYLAWERPETDEEMNKRIAKETEAVAQARSKKRLLKKQKEEKERALFEELKKKYEK